jgi:hypothetical protein
MMKSRNGASAEASANQSDFDAARKNIAMREKRAQSLAAMGLVSREDSHYVVRGAAVRGQQQSYQVTRNEGGRVVCSCEEFERHSTNNPVFRCEHILAVKYSLAPPASDAAPETAVEASGNPHLNGNEPNKGVEVMNENQQDATEDKIEIESGAEMKSEPAPPAPMFAETLRVLRRPVDSRLIKTREGWTDRQGGTHWVEYIEWHTVADILDRVAPTWSHAVRNITQVGDMVAVTAAITIDGVTREGIGTGSADNETGIKKAEHDALKRAAVKFGIARDLYQRESDVIERENAAPNLMRDARARSAAEQVTGKQLWMIRSIGREMACDVEQECQALFQCGLEEISKRAASQFIDYLKRRQQEGDVVELRQAS